MSNVINEELLYEFLNREGVSNLSKTLLTKVNMRIEERIVNNVDENSDTNHVPSAAAVYNAINKMTHIKFKTHTGDINTIEEPNSSYIYLQRDDENDTTWMMYVYDSEDLGWINIGDTEVNLSNYWSKDAADIEALKLALGIQNEITQVNNRIDKFVEEINTKIKNLPANLLFDENGDFAINLSAAMETSVIDYMFTLERPGMYTIYAERGCPDNPFSAVDSSFRGICHITQLENDNPSDITGNQKMYGWIMLFDQEGNAHTNYIRRSVASGWKSLNEKATIDEEINKLEGKINDQLENKVNNTQLVSITNDEIEAAVESAYTETTPNI